MNYSEIKKEIEGFYQKYGRVTIDNIEDTNDHILDDEIKTEQLNDKTEFFTLVAMCAHMVEYNVYDEYIFGSYRELINDFLSEREPDFVSDVGKINEYLRRDDIKAQFYDGLSDLINNKVAEYEDEEEDEELPEDNNMQ